LVRFRSQLTRLQVARMKAFFEDLAAASCCLLMVPPHTALPKKHLTLKKLRIAQRLREEVAACKEDRSHSRLWTPLDCQQVLSRRPHRRPR
jgi:hypothetical protein